MDPIPSGGRAVVEREWQFVADLESAERWLANPPPGVVVGAPRDEEILDVYFEGSGWTLARAGFTCRLRVTAHAVLLTLKGFGVREGGARVRTELSQPLPAVVPPEAWPPGAVTLALGELARAETLSPLFTLRTHRRTWPVAGHAGPPAALLSLDRCEVGDAGGAPRGWLERLELEALAGYEEEAARLVVTLTESLGLRPAPTSKFLAACGFLGLVPPVRD